MQLVSGVWRRREINRTQEWFRFTGKIILLLIPVIFLGTCEILSSPPEIRSVTASAVSVETGGTVTFVCEAQGAEGGSLVYEWTATGGTFDSTSDRTVTWTAPTEPGEYTIEAVVYDDLGMPSEPVTKVISVAEAVNSAPEITSLEPAATTVAYAGVVAITCTAEDDDGDPLAFVWSATHGELSAGGGAAVDWTAPSGTVTATISVTVSDGQGHEVTDSVEISVVAEYVPARWDDVMWDAFDWE